MPAAKPSLLATCCAVAPAPDGEGILNPVTAQLFGRGFSSGLTVSTDVRRVALTSGRRWRGSDNDSGRRRRDRRFVLPAALPCLLVAECWEAGRPRRRLLVATFGHLALLRHTDWQGGRLGGELKADFAIGSRQLRLRWLHGMWPGHIVCGSLLAAGRRLSACASAATTKLAASSKSADEGRRSPAVPISSSAIPRSSTCHPSLKGEGKCN